VGYCGCFFFCSVIEQLDGGDLGKAERRLNNPFLDFSRIGDFSGRILLYLGLWKELMNPIFRVFIAEIFTTAFAQDQVRAINTAMPNKEVTGTGVIEVFMKKDVQLKKTAYVFFVPGNGNFSFSFLDCKSM
jgi:hypothetical protein